MSKKSRKIKWKGVALNHSNIDEYMKDLQEETAGQYITQGVSFNKDDNFQMNLLKNSILAHGSFSGFVKHLLYAHFEKNGSIDNSVWQPNTVVDSKEREEAVSQPSPSPAPPVNSNVVEEVPKVVEPVEQTTKNPVVEPIVTDKPTPVVVKPTTRRKKKNLDAFVTPEE